ncbi:MAG: tetratricopeptide repeat protein [Bryobacteraceae bacterium]
MTLLLAFFLQASLIEQADQAFRNGEIDRAEKLAQQAAAREPGSPHAHMILGVIAATRAQWAPAVQHFQTVTRLVPADPHAYFYLGQARLNQKQWQAAVDLFTRALNLKYPERERLLIELAFAENEAGRPAAALKRLEGVEPPAEGPMAAQYHAVKAFAGLRMGKSAEAIEAMAKARDLDPDNEQYQEFLISTLIGVDQTARALAEAIRAQSKFPDSPEIQFLFGLASYYVPESPLGAVALRNVREAEPTGARALLAQGLLDRKAGKMDEAVRAFEGAASKGLPDSHLLLAIVYREKGDMAGAEREFALAERANPQNGQVALEAGKLALTRGDLAGALKRLTLAADRMPQSSAAHYQLGLALRRAGKAAEAEEHLTRSRELDRLHAEAAVPK